MIKNLLNADEEPPPGTKVVIEDSIVNPAVPTPSIEAPVTQETSANTDSPAVFEIPGDAKFFTPTSAPPETAPLNEGSESLSALMAGIENLDDKDLDVLERKLEAARAEQSTAEPVRETVTEQTAAENVPLIETVSDEKTDSFPSGTLFKPK